MPKQKPKQKDKKKTAKELEAERLEEERIKKLELKLENEKKFGINPFTSGTKRTPMLLTSWFLQECWNNDSPRKFARTHILKIMENLGNDREIRDNEIEMFANAIIYALIHGKDKLKFNDKKLYYFVNLIFYLFVTNDQRFEKVNYVFIGDEEEEEEEIEEKGKGGKGKKDKKGKKKEEEEEETEALVDEEDEFDREEISIDMNSFQGKNYDVDLKGFKVLIGGIVKENFELFYKEEIARIVTYAIDNYFNNYRLFNYCQTHEQTEENIYLQVSVDEPSLPEPLSSAKYLGKIMTPEDIEAERLKKIAEEEAKKKSDEEERLKQEEEARKEYEQWMGLDEQTVQMIKNKLEETKEYMMKRVEEKKVEYEEKAANSKAFKKKKR